MITTLCILGALIGVLFLRWCCAWVLANRVSKFVFGCTLRKAAKAHREFLLLSWPPYMRYAGIGSVTLTNKQSGKSLIVELHYNDYTEVEEYVVFYQPKTGSRRQRLNVKQWVAEYMWDTLYDYSFPRADGWR